MNEKLNNSFYFLKVPNLRKLLIQTRMLLINLLRERGRISIGGSDRDLGASGQLKYVTQGKGFGSGWEPSILQKKLPELMILRLGRSEARKLR